MGFAGAQRIDERRRRRLAVTADESPATVRRRIDTAHVAASGGRSLDAGSPVLTWMPRARWPLAVATTASGVATLAAVVFAVWAESEAVWRPVAGVRSGRLLSSLCVALCLASAQLCYLVYWYRKRSRRDFAGLYRRWLTSAAACCVAAACVGTGVHGTLGRLASEQLPPAVWNTPAAGWVVPSAVVVLLLGPALWREMLAARAGAALLVVAACAIAANLLLQIGGRLLLPPGWVRLASELLTVAAVWSLFHSLWWHARHVVRVCNEPPKSGRLKATLRRAMPTRVRTQQPDAPAPVEVSGPKRRRRIANTAGSDVAVVDPDAPAVDADSPGRPGVTRRLLSAATAPVRVPLERVRARRVSAAERRELRREAKAAVKAEKAAARQASREEAAAAKDAAKVAKAEAAERKRAEVAARREEAAAARQAASDAKAAEKEQKRAARREKAAARPEPVQSGPSEPAPPPEPASDARDDRDRTPDTEGRSRRKRKQDRRDRSNERGDGGDASVENAADWNEDWSDGETGGNRKQSRKARKRRRDAA